MNASWSNGLPLIVNESSRSSLFSFERLCSSRFFPSSSPFSSSMVSIATPSFKMHRYTSFIWNYERSHLWLAREGHHTENNDHFQLVEHSEIRGKSTIGKHERKTFRLFDISRARAIQLSFSTLFLSFSSRWTWLFAFLSVNALLIGCDCIDRVRFLTSPFFVLLNPFAPGGLWVYSSTVKSFLFHLKIARLERGNRYILYFCCVRVATENFI